MLTQVPTRILGNRIRCEGGETSILDCPSDYSKVAGENMAECSSSSSSARPAAILCEQGYIQLGENMRTSTRKGFLKFIEHFESETNYSYRGMPHLTTKIGSKGNTTLYFCADTFSDDDAKVFCAMKSWKFGKAVSLSSSEQAPPSGEIRLSNPRCNGDEPHILDCGHEEDATCETAAAVECSPGFPFTLRLHNNLSEEIPESQLAIG